MPRRDRTAVLRRRRCQTCTAYKAPSRRKRPEMTSAVRIIQGSNSVMALPSSSCPTQRCCQAGSHQWCGDVHFRPVVRKWTDPNFVGATTHNASHRVTVNESICRVCDYLGLARTRHTWRTITMTVNAIKTFHPVAISVGPFGKFDAVAFRKRIVGTPGSLQLLSLSLRCPRKWRVGFGPNIGGQFHFAISQSLRHRCRADI